MLHTIKGKGCPVTCQAGTQGLQRYSSTHARPRLLYHQERDPVRTLEKAWWVSGLVWMGPENLTPTWVRTPDCPARNESLYRLRYPGQQFTLLGRSKDEDQGLQKKGGYTRRISRSHFGCCCRHKQTINSYDLRTRTEVDGGIFERLL